MHVQMHACVFVHETLTQDVINITPNPLSLFHNTRLRTVGFVPLQRLVYSRNLVVSGHILTNGRYESSTREESRRQSRFGRCVITLAKMYGILQLSDNLRVIPPLSMRESGLNLKSTHGLHTLQRQHIGIWCLAGKKECFTAPRFDQRDQHAQVSSRLCQCPSISVGAALPWLLAR